MATATSHQATLRIRDMAQNTQHVTDALNTLRDLHPSAQNREPLKSSTTPHIVHPSSASEPSNSSAQPRIPQLSPASDRNSAIVQQNAHNVTNIQAQMVNISNHVTNNFMREAQWIPNMVGRLGAWMNRHKRLVLILSCLVLCYSFICTWSPSILGWKLSFFSSWTVCRPAVSVSTLTIPWLFRTAPKPTILPRRLDKDDQFDAATSLSVLNLVLGLSEEIISTVGLESISLETGTFYHDYSPVFARMRADFRVLHDVTSRLEDDHREYQVELNDTFNDLRDICPQHCTGYQARSFSFEQLRVGLMRYSPSSFTNKTIAARGNCDDELLFLDHMINLNVNLMSTESLNTSATQVSIAVDRFHTSVSDFHQQLENQWHRYEEACGKWSNIVFPITQKTRRDKYRLESFAGKIAIVLQLLEQFLRDLWSYQHRRLSLIDSRMSTQAAIRFKCDGSVHRFPFTDSSSQSTLAAPILQRSSSADTLSSSASSSNNVMSHKRPEYILPPSQKSLDLYIKIMRSISRSASLEDFFDMYYDAYYQWERAWAYFLNRRPIARENRRRKSRLQ